MYCLCVNVYCHRVSTQIAVDKYINIKFTYVLRHGELITRPEDSYRLWCVVVCDLETSWMRRSLPSEGLSHQKQTNKLRHGELHLQSCYISSVACSVFLEMVRCWSHLSNSHEPYLKLNVQNKPFPSNGSPFCLSLFFFYIGKDGRKLFFYKVGVKPSGWVLVGRAYSLMCLCFYNTADEREALNDRNIATVTKKDEWR
jgi:hypothetical protein